MYCRQAWDHRSQVAWASYTYYYSTRPWFACTADLVVIVAYATSSGNFVWQFTARRFQVDCPFDENWITSTHANSTGLIGTQSWPRTIVWRITQKATVLWHQSKVLTVQMQLSGNEQQRRVGLGFKCLHAVIMCINQAQLGSDIQKFKCDKWHRTFKQFSRSFSNVAYISDPVHCRPVNQDGHGTLSSEQYIHVFLNCSTWYY